MRVRGARDTSCWRRAYRGAVADPTIVAALALAILFALGHETGFSLDRRVGFFVATIVIARLTKAIGLGRVQPANSGWRVWVRTGCRLVPAAGVMYALGLGPTLAIGFGFGVVESLRDEGANATTPALVWTIASLALGEFAIATGVTPTLVEEPLVHGIALLAALGSVFTILALGHATRRAELAQARVREREEHFSALVQHTADIIMVGNPADGSIHYASPAFESVLGYSLPEALEMSGYSIVHEDDVESVRSLTAPTSGASPHRLEVRLQRRDGEWRWFDITMTDLTSNPAVGAWVANLHDVTERKLSEAALGEVQAVFRHAFADAPTGIVLTDVNGSILRANRSFARLFRMDEDDIVDVSMMMLTHPADRLTRQLQHEQLLRGEADHYRLDARCTRADGTMMWASSNTSVVRDSDGVPIYLIIHIEDVTERKVLNDRLAYEASHDAITGLANRATFTEELSRRLSADTAAGRHVGVLLVDLDHFKVVNDSLGRAASDELLTMVAHRLRNVLRSRDVVARLGTDEFAVLVGDLTDAKAALDVAERLAAALSTSVQLSHGDVFMTANIGVALSEAGDTADTLIRDADAAMQQARHGGGSRIEIFDRRDERKPGPVPETGSELERALERNEFVLHYQPVVDLHTALPVGVEAFLRWLHPTRGLLLPGDFLHRAEETGLIVPIGEWVLRTACTQAAQWRATSRDSSDHFFVSVNLSPRQLVDPTLVTTVRKILHATGCNPSLLRVEVTEDSLMYDCDAALHTLDALQQLGIRASIDDFGSGFTSLAYLKRLPIDTLKIDRALVRAVVENTDQRAIVEGIVALANTLGLSTLAEGVEREEQLDCLRALGCGYAQGYLFGRPDAEAERHEQPDARDVNGRRGR